MQMRSVYKVPNGKLIKIFLEYNKPSKIIQSIILSGDFFAYPEDSIKKLEEVLTGKTLDKTSLEQMIEKFVEDNQVEFIGISAASITDAIMRCK